MARSPAHKLGQLIGDYVEDAIGILLEPIARRHGLYLDRKGDRPARQGRKVSWADEFGNTHDLDYVIERDGTPEKHGVPVAFIESAWRSYTKHSRNKAQEIQGAILPLAMTHRKAAPFVGVVLAGVFTPPALAQLRSQGFAVVLLPHERIVRAFGATGLDIRFGEDTPNSEARAKLEALERLPQGRRKAVWQAILDAEPAQIREFVARLERVITRQIRSVSIMPLHGLTVEKHSVSEAIAYLEGYPERETARPLVRYELAIRYDNGDRIECSFQDRDSALDFLRSFVPPAMRPAR